MLTYREFAKYGVQTTFMFALEDITDAEAPFTGVAPVTGDIWLSKDGGAAANATNAFTAISNGIYTWVATATELQATRLQVNVYDATASAIFKPLSINILTKLQLGQIDVDATAIGSNTVGITATGIGTGAGISAIGGATGSGIKATGTSTSGRGIEVVNATGNLYLSNLFDQQLPAEHSTAFAATDSVGRTIGRLVRRFFNKVTQTSTQQKVYADDSSTVVDTMTCSNDLTTQTKGKAA